jgi:hypothetical protein
LDEGNKDLLWVTLLKAKYRVYELFTSTPSSCSKAIHAEKLFER